MKTMIFRTVMIAIIALFVSGLKMNAQEPFYDTKWENGKMETRTKYVMGYSGLYEKSILTEYFYNESGEFYMKVVSKWNRRKECWVPDYRIVHKKEEISNIVSCEYATWNAKKGEYNDPKEKMIYQQNKSSSRFFYLAFQKDNKIKEWVNTGVNEELLAGVLGKMIEK